MSDQASEQPRPLNLNVLPHSGKVEQLKSAVRGESAGEEVNAIDPSVFYIPHVNKTRPTGQLTPQQQELERRIIEQIREVYDPEIPINIYELGLVYDIEIDAENNVMVRMTLTAPGCPVAGVLPGTVEQRVEAVPEVKSATVELVWDPPWNKDMMSEAARMMLNI